MHNVRVYNLEAMVFELVGERRKCLPRYKMLGIVARLYLSD